ncbi:MAG: chain-length determining protein [Prevotella sp.]|nr:chain-length determining protein [Prevotella sp.]
MEDNKYNQEVMEEESSIDFGKIFKDLLRHKTLYYKVLPLAFVLAAIYALSLPNFYQCTVKLAPELGASAKSGGSLASLASSFGVNLGGAQAGADAITPMLYPDLMNSVDFKTSLFPVKVTRKDDNKTITYYDYLMNEQKTPWWSKGMKAFFGLFSSAPEPVEGEKVDPFQLTKEQTDIVKAINKNVVCDVDKKTFVITINVTDQDPLICATLADSVKTRLQKFITDYRTSKARVDLEYNKKLYGEAKARYEQARNKYAAFSDSHRDVSSQSAQTRQSDLQNEMNMQQQIYQQVVAQLQQAEMKVQQETPAFTTFQSATVPVLKAGPKRAQMCLIFLFLAFLGTTAYILYKEDDLKPLLGLS